MPASLRLPGFIYKSLERGLDYLELNNNFLRNRKPNKIVEM